MPTQYASAADMQAVMGLQLLLDIVDLEQTGTVPTATLNGYLLDASSIADSYLGPWLPLTEVTPALKRAVLSIAIFHICSPTNRATDDVVGSYKEAISWLRDVSKGVATLGIARPVPDSGTLAVLCEERLWSRSSGGRLF